MSAPTTTTAAAKAAATTTTFAPRADAPAFKPAAAAKAADAPAFKHVAPNFDVAFAAFVTGLDRSAAATSEEVLTIAIELALADKSITPELREFIISQSNWSSEGASSDWGADPRMLAEATTFANGILEKALAQYRALPEDDRVSRELASAEAAESNADDDLAAIHECQQKPHVHHGPKSTKNCNHGNKCFSRNCPFVHPDHAEHMLAVEAKAKERKALAVARKAGLQKTLAQRQRQGGRASGTQLRTVNDSERSIRKIAAKMLANKQIIEERLPEEMRMKMRNASQLWLQLVDTTFLYGIAGFLHDCWASVETMRGEGKSAREMQKAFQQDHITMAVLNHLVIEMPVYDGKALMQMMMELCDMKFYLVALKSETTVHKALTAPAQPRGRK